MSFWAVHGWIGGFFFLLFLSFWPRPTILFSVAISALVSTCIIIPFGLTGSIAGLVTLIFTIVGWVAWLFLPRVLIAVIALSLYGETNLVLCIGACFLAYVCTQGSWAFWLGLYRRLREPFPSAGEDAEDHDTDKQEIPAQKLRPSVSRWWEVLGVSPEASADAIRLAFRQIARRTHPDTAPDGKSDVHAFQKANEAYRKGLKEAKR